MFHHPSNYYIKTLIVSQRTWLFFVTHLAVRSSVWDGITDISVEVVTAKLGPHMRCLSISQIHDNTAKHVQPKQVSENTILNTFIRNHCCIYHLHVFIFFNVSIQLTTLSFKNNKHSIIFFKILPLFQNDWCMYLFSEFYVISIRLINKQINANAHI